MTNRTVSVRLLAEVSGYVMGVHKAAQATRSLADDARRHLGTVSRELAGTSKAAQLVGSIGVIALGRQFVNSASNMNETVNKTSVVFGNAADSVKAWSKDSATAMGMSEQQAQEAAGTFGNLFVSMKIGQQPAAAMSKSLVQLAGDLASFNNADPTDTLEALRSGLVGEVEPLRKYGVNLSEVTLKQKAMEMGLVSTTTGVLPPAIRTQAAYALILEQTKTAQGDFARTADGLANSQRTATAEWENAKAALGQELLPVVNAGTQQVTRMLGVVNGLPEPLRLVAVGAGVAAAGFLILAPRAVDTYDAFKRIEMASPRAGKGIAAVGKAAAAAGVAMVAVKAAASVWDGIADATTNAGLGANQLQQVLEKLAATGQGGDPLGFKTMGDTVWSFNDAMDWATHSGWADEGFTSALGFVGVDTNLAKARDSIDQVDKALASMVQSGHAEQAAQAVDVLRRNWIASGGTAEEFDAQLNDYKDALAGATNSTTQLGDASSGAAANIKALDDAVSTLRGTQMSADEATANLEAAIDKATAAAKENGKAVSASTDAGRANGQALRDIATAALDGVDAWVQNGASAKTVAAKTEEARDAFIKTAIQMGWTEKAAEDLATKYGLIPTKVQTAVVVTGAARALSLLQTINAEIRKLPGHSGVAIAVTGGGDLVGHGTGGGKPIKRAGGGWIHGAGTATSDSIDVRASNGEYMVNARAAAANRGALDAMNYGRDTRSRAARYGAGAGASAGVNLYVDVQIPPTVRPADRALIREQVHGAVQEAITGVGDAIAWRGKR